ncbi:hypothetical protein EV140_0875 [Microcella alkaliphila]|uniref:Uncharacterized protein n=1 Tax=Microcella alkaliphila TaxID=279828 RepID=A0A4Q7TP03_9MICO|nr:hypothetical protein EV140_0875 [Microcella alkaliphila]
MPTIMVVVVTWALMLLAQTVPGVCALARPCPEPDARVAPALLFGGLMMLPAAGLILTAWVERGWAWWVRLALYVVLIGLAVAGLGAVLFAGGFTIGFPL